MEAQPSAIEKEQFPSVYTPLLLKITLSNPVQLQLSGPRGRIGLQVHALIVREVRRTLYRDGTFNP